MRHHNNIERHVGRIKNIKRKRHDNLVIQLENRLRNSKVNYDLIGKNHEYGPRDFPIGELDLFAVKGRRMLIFEIKAVDHLNAYNKSLEQLKRAEEYFSGEDLYTFYVTPSRGRRIKPPYNRHKGLLGK